MAPIVKWPAFFLFLNIKIWAGWYLIHEQGERENKDSPGFVPTRGPPVVDVPRPNPDLKFDRCPNLDFTRKPQIHGLSCTYYPFLRVRKVQLGRSDIRKEKLFLKLCVN